MPSLINWIVVLGDFGRSPRMQYHAKSLASKPGSIVHVIAYDGAAPLASLLAAPNVHITHLPEVPSAIQRLPGLLRLTLKVLHQLLAMLWIMLIRLPAPSNILMQNPPCIPTMMLCWLAAKRHGASLVMDWHNFGHSIMALKRPASSPVVRLARSHEAAWGRMGDKHFCVTRAMQQELAGQAWRVAATVLYDRPPRHFRRTDVSTAHELLVRLAPAVAGIGASAGTPGRVAVSTPMASEEADFAAERAIEWNLGRTIATTTTGVTSVSGKAGAAAVGAATWRPDRPAILISSTSWTPDEDFGVLLDALVLYEASAKRQQSEEERRGGGAAAAQRSLARAPNVAPALEPGAYGGIGVLPNLLVFITGRGPQRDMYLNRVSELRMRHVAVRSLWLEAADYPLLLGAADLGVSLHASSSGLDLPMKVVDMFGAGLPVCALAYNCIGELVEDGETGLLFDGPERLCEQLQTLFRGFPAAPSGQLLHMQRRVAEKEQGLPWEENWDKVAWPLLRQK